MTDKISDDYKQAMLEKISLERFGPEDVANAVLFYLQTYLIILQEKQYMLMVKTSILVDKII